VKLSNRPCSSPSHGSAFAGFRFPAEVIVMAVRWYLRYGLSYRDVEKLLVERGAEVDHVTVYRRIPRFTPLLARRGPVVSALAAGASATYHLTFNTVAETCRRPLVPSTGCVRGSRVKAHDARRPALVLERRYGCRRGLSPSKERTAMILPKVRDPRFITLRRGGTLTDSDHHLLALWAASCAEHVLHLFESVQPEDRRPREAIEHARAWVRSEVKMMQARAAGGHAMGAARDLRGAARHAAYAAGQAGAVAHVAAHELGAAAYAIKAVRAAVPEGESDAAGRLECRWQRDQLPDAIRELVLDDQRLRNDICWSVFDC